MPNCVPGKSSCTASAMRWAEVCQKVCLPSGSSHVRMLIFASFSMGRLRSSTSSSTFTAKAAFASCGDMPVAISSPVTPALYCFFEPSGKLSSIIDGIVCCYYLVGRKCAMRVALAVYGAKVVILLIMNTHEVFFSV